MSGAHTILPGAGRGTMRSMVEGYVPPRRVCEVRQGRPFPTTTLRVVPLPLAGEEPL